MITLVLHFDGPEAEATLLWLSPEGEETRYTDVRRGASIRQETFEGHTWVLRGKASGAELFRVTAAPEPAQQEHRVDGDNVAVRADPVPPRGTAAAVDNAEPDEDAELAGGLWSGSDFKFERVRQSARCFVHHAGDHSIPTTARADPDVIY